MSSEMTPAKAGKGKLRRCGPLALGDSNAIRQRAAAAAANVERECADAGNRNALSL
jgi:hypothetical protein